MASNLEPRLRLYWSKRENDLMANWDPDATSASARYMMDVLSVAVLKDLDDRGYDVSTIRFQIRRKPTDVLDKLAIVTEPEQRRTR